MQSNIYGKSSEIIASNYLKDLGYRIIATNYKNKIGEIDIIAKNNNTIVFVEVKSRSSRAFGDPLEAIDERKIYKIHNAALGYLKFTKQLDACCRFDAISILGKGDDYEIRHIIDAF